LLNNDQARSRALAFNHALYLMHVRNTSAAVEILDGLRGDSTDQSLQAKALFTLSRIRYQAFQLEKDPSYFQDALQLAQQSVRRDASHALAKLFLDYLLSIDRQAVEVDVSPLEGEGTGESEGERGAISTDPGEF
jgi:thioredoxin-like negative regulator of GroEL